MSVKVDKLENNMAKLTIEVPPEEFEKAVSSAYNRNKGRISIPGFRKGKAPRNVIERMYGKDIFYEDAANEIVPGAYREAADECGERIVSNPTFDVVQVEAGLPFIFTAEVALRPPVSLGKYKGVSVTKTDDTVTKEEVEAEIERERDLNARMEEVKDRAVKDKDIIKLDFEGFIDDKPFDGGKGEDYTLTIGAGQFIPGFEEQLIGAEIGTEKDVNVTFPEDYHAEDLKGKDATFKCTVKEIREKVLPDLDDEYASDFTEFETFEEYKKSIEERLQKQRSDENRRKKEDEAVAAIVEDSEMELPEPMIEAQQNSMMSEMDQRLRMQGMNIAQYAQMMGLTLDTLKDQSKTQAIQRIKTRLVLEEIVEKEGIVISDEDFEKELEESAKNYGMTVERLKELMDERQMKQMREDIAVGKAADFVVDNAKETKKAEKKEKDKEEKK